MSSLVVPESYAVLAGLRHRLGTAIILVAAFASSVGAFEAIHRRSAFEDATNQPGGWPGVIVVVAASAVVHELIHALGWISLAKLPWRSVSVRRTLRVMGLVVCANTAMPVPAFRLSTLLPAVILGGGSVATGLVSGRGLLVLWGNFFLLECYSDLTVLLATARLPAAAKVREYPDQLGCAVTEGRSEKT